MSAGTRASKARGRKPENRIPASLSSVLCLLRVGRLVLARLSRGPIGGALRLRLLLARPVRVGAAHRPDVGELCTEEEDLRGVIHPKENDRQRTGGAECGSGAALSEVEADQVLTDGKEQRRKRGSGPYVPPGDVAVRQDLVNEGEQRGDCGQRTYRVERV